MLNKIFPKISTAIGKVYELPMLSSYVKSWGTPEAVREFLQNAIDSGSPLEYNWSEDDFDLGFSEDGYYEGEPRYALEIISQGQRLPKRSLLLGASSKSEDSTKIGAFGEGYKLAMLVLLREGKRVSIVNGDELWTPFFDVSEQFEGEETLHVSCVPLAGTFRHDGVTFRVGGLTQKEKEEIETSCLRLQSEEQIGKKFVVREGEVLLDKPGMLFVGGLFVCKTSFKFGYDVMPQHLQLERDRNTVSSFDLAWLAKDMWFQHEDYELVARLIAEDHPDFQYSEHGVPNQVKEACWRIFQKQNPGKIVAKTMASLEQQIKSGMSREKIVYVGQNYGSIVSLSSGYKKASERIGDAVNNPSDVLKKFLKENPGAFNRKTLKEFQALILQSKTWKF